MRALLLTLLLAAGPLCPVDDSTAYFTGRVETVSGYLMHQYKCMLYGHLFWVRA